jgi:hypothetical protein
MKAVAVDRITCLVAVLRWCPRAATLRAWAADRTTHCTPALRIWRKSTIESAISAAVMSSETAMP